MSDRPFVWFHSCTLHGPCDPPCTDPWQVDAPEGWGWIRFYEAPGNFATQVEAMNFAMQVAADPESELERLPNYLYPTESETTE